jgi:hypothetical protein
MYRLSLTVILSLGAAVPSVAQRLDGCVNYAAPGVHEITQAPTRDARDRGLQNSGYSLTRDSLLSALADQRADVRAVAAQKLAENGGRAVLEPILQAWSTEKDSCTKSGMAGALSETLHAVAWDWTCPHF